MALNTPIIFHEPYGFSMLECFNGVLWLFSYLRYLVQISCNSQPRLRPPCWAYTGPILWLFYIHSHYNWLMKRQYVGWTISSQHSFPKGNKCMKHCPGETVHVKDKFSFFICTAAPCSYHLFGERLSSLPETH